MWAKLVTRSDVIANMNPMRDVSAGKQRAEKIQSMLLEGASNIEIIQALEVSHSTISRINSGESYRNPLLHYPLR